MVARGRPLAGGEGELRAVRIFESRTTDAMLLVYATPVSTAISPQLPLLLRHAAPDTARARIQRLWSFHAASRLADELCGSLSRESRGPQMVEGKGYNAHISSSPKCWLLAWSSPYTMAVHRALSW